MDYNEWIPKVLEAVGMTEQALHGASGEWFLRPREGSIGPDEAAELFVTIRKHLFGGKKKPTPAAVRQSLRELDGLETLPVLFSMTYIARNWGRSAEYWPAFCTYVLNDELDLHVLHQLAPEFTELWRRLRRFSPTLHVPTEGRSNIKWPLIHAGLLSDEEVYLRSFGVWLVRETGTDSNVPHPYLFAEVDEFRTILLAWLAGRSWTSRALFRRLKSEDTGLSVAVVAQRFLHDVWAQLLQEESWGGITSTGVYRHPRVRLRFDPENRRIWISLVDGRWAGRPQLVRVEFDGRSTSWPVEFDPTAECTVGSLVELPVTRSGWEAGVTVRTETRYHTYSVLPTPFRDGKGGLLFDGVSGLRVRTIQPNESYFLLLPDSLRSAGWVDRLFAQVISLGEPLGNWQGYTAYRVVTGNWVQLVKDQEFDEVGDQMLEHGVGFRLPAAQELLRPRSRLVGGVPLSDRTLQRSTYSASTPPLLEVTGRWPFGITVELFRTGNRLTGDAACGTVKLPATIHETRSCISLFEGAAEPGTYRLSVGGERLDFDLVEDRTAPVFPYVLRMELCIGGEALHGRAFGTHLLEEGKFRVMAWPEALVTLLVRTGAKSDRFNAGTCDAAGRMEFSLTDFYLDGVPGGRLEVWAENGPAVSETLSFASHPYCISDPILSTDSTPTFSTKVALVSPGQSVTCLLFGNEPWTGEMWVCRSTVRPDHTVRFSFPQDAVRARYVAVSGGSGVPEGVPWLASILEGRNQSESSWRLGGDGHWEDWLPWMEWLHTQPVAEREIQDLAAFSKIAWTVRNHFHTLQGPEQGWKAPGPALRADLRALLQTRSAPRVALVPKMFPVASVSHLVPRFLSEGPAPGLALSGTAAMAVVADSVPADGVLVEVCENRLVDRVVVRSGTGGSFCVQAVDSVVHCISCGRVVPFQAMNAHERPLRMQEYMCNHLVELFPGMETELQLAIEWIPSRLASAMIDMFTSIVEREKLPGGTTSLRNWFLELKPLIPRGAGAPPQLAWFREVAAIAAAMVEILLYPTLPHDGGHLRPLTPVFDKYPEAVLKVAERLVFWLDGGA